MGSRRHQDNTPIQELSWEAILNIEADKIAAEARHETTAESTPFVQLSASKVMLYINQLPIRQSAMHKILYAWTTQRLQTNMTTQFKWDANANDTIDWYSHGSIIMSQDYYKQYFNMKLIHKQLPV
jgi:hypothetical protein